ncbi:MAG: NusG domain II-containing protein [Evtepia gabavorous]
MDSKVSPFQTEAGPFGPCIDAAAPQSLVPATPFSTGHHILFCRVCQEESPVFPRKRRSPPGPPPAKTLAILPECSKIFVSYPLVWRWAHAPSFLRQTPSFLASAHRPHRPGACGRPGRPSLHRQSGAMVQITQDGQVVGTYSLQQPRTLRYESQDGGYNIVVIADGKVRVSEASCPDQVCVRTGPTDQTASPIACLPNRLVIQVIDNGTSSQLDGVS